MEVKGPVPARKILYFTDRNIYIGEGKLIVGMGYGVGGLIGSYIEKKVVSDKEKEARIIKLPGIGSQGSIKVDDMLIYLF